MGKDIIGNNGESVILYDAYGRPLNSTNGALHSATHDGFGNPIGSTFESLNVHAADVHFKALNLHFKQDTGVSETFGSGGASIGDSIFDVAAGQGATFSAGNFTTIKEGDVEESDIVKILNVTTDTITIDRPLENDYTAAGVIEITDQDLSGIVGTVASPDIYSFGPASGLIYHITILHLMIFDGPQPGIELFGGISGLSNGLVLRQNNGEKRNNVILRTNGDMMEYFGEESVKFVQKVGGGDWGTVATWHLKEHTDSVIRLNGNNGDTWDVIGQDTLTALTEFEMIAGGHVEVIS